MESLSVIGRKEKICDVSCGRQDVDQTPNASDHERWNAAIAATKEFFP